jgi:hypothetical protein
MLRIVAVTAVLALIVPGSAMADTGGGTTPVDDYLVGAGFTFSDHGVLYVGSASVEDERISGQRNGAFGFEGSGTSQLCDAGTPGDPSDDYTGTQIIDYSSSAVKVTAYQVDSALASGSFELATTGRRITIDACTGEIIRSKRERHRFKLQLVASGAVVTTEDIVGPMTERFSIVDATGTGLLDRTGVQLTGSSLQHMEIFVSPV